MTIIADIYVWESTLIRTLLRFMRYNFLSKIIINKIFSLAYV